MSGGRSPLASDVRCPPSACQPSTRRSSPSRAPAPTCTSAGSRPSRRPRHVPRPSFDDAVRRTSRVGSATRRATASASRPMPLGLHAPLWVDAEDFDPGRAHPPLGRASDARGARRRRAVASRCARDRPLWEFWIAPELRRRPHRPRRQGPSLHGRRHRGGRAGRAAARRRAGARRRRRARPIGCPAPAPHALELAGPRRVGPRARASSALRWRRSSSRARRSRCRRSRVRTGRALAGAVLPVAPARALLNAAELAGPPPRHRARARSTSCARSGPLTA